MRPHHLFVFHVFVSLALGGCEGEPSPTEPPAAAPDAADMNEDSERNAEPEAATELAGEEVEPGAPEDYGLIKPKLPPPAPEELVAFAFATPFINPIYDRLGPDPQKIGYIRLGSVVRVTDKLSSDEGCKEGWRAVEQGGFLCSKWLSVSDRPPSSGSMPAAPKLDQPLPYDYAYVRHWNTPMWWRLPGAGEQSEADRIRELREAERNKMELLNAPQAAGGDVAQPSATVPSSPNLSDQVANVEGGAEPTAEPPPARPGAAVVAIPPAGLAPLAGAEPIDPMQPRFELPLDPTTPWLEKGFFISLSGQISRDNRNWWFTARNAYVDARHARKYSAKDFSGVELPPDASFPFGFAMNTKGVQAYDLTDGDRIKPTRKLEHRTFLNFTDETEIEGKSYLVTIDGELVRKDHVRVVEPQAPPEGIEPWERWIDVSLGTQILVAYEGSQPVYVTLVSTGRKGTEEEPFETPTGRWRIYSKHVSTKMAGDTASDGNYSIQDVPWTMFFEGDYALHGAFWHESFGRVRSHGCINLGPSAAQWLFLWTTPFLPEGWHGVHAHEGSPGTQVIVRE